MAYFDLTETEQPFRCKHYSTSSLGFNKLKIRRSIKKNRKHYLQSRQQQPQQRSAPKCTRFGTSVKPALNDAS